MKKQTSPENKARLSALVNAVGGVRNTPSRALASTFNFKGRKSEKIAQIALETLTEPGDTVFEPFMGSGTFVIAAARAGRKIIATELDNYTYSAVRALLVRVDLGRLSAMFEAVESAAKAEVMALYETSCCGEPNYISKLLYDPAGPEYFNPRPNREITDGENIKLHAACSVCGATTKRFDERDMEKLKSTENEDVSDFPNVRYIENSRINITRATGADSYGRIFSARSKRALLLLQQAVLRLEPGAERDVLEHSLVSALTLARTAMYGSSSDILYHVVPFGAQECNVWELFESKYLSFREFKRRNDALLADDPRSDEKYELYPMAYQDYCAARPGTARFDIIYTDFPYTDQVPYLERNQLYRVWLDTFYAPGHYALTGDMLEKEIVLTDAKSRPRKREIETYYADIDSMLAHFGAVLKDSGLVVFTAKLGKSKYFRTLVETINLARKNGFEYVLRFGIDKNDPSLRKQSAYRNTLSNEMVIALEKLPEEERYWYVGNQNYELETVKLIYRLLSAQPGREITITQAVMHVRDALIKRSHIATEGETEKIQRLVRQSFIVDENTAAVKIDHNKIYLDIEDQTDLFTKFYNYMPIIIRRLLEATGRFVLDDLYFEIANTLCTGDPVTINQFLDDARHQASITRLLDNYCDSDGNAYVKKNYGSAVSAGAADISTLEGTDFERLIKKLLEAEGYEDVFISGGSGDLGVDLLAAKAEDGIRKIYLFQCKRWANDVGSEAMQRLIAERLRRSADVAICVTTSGFTKDGRFAAGEGDVELWDGELVARKLDLWFPGEYYNGSLKPKG